jgi:ribonucleoside-diphosphate reductase alpha chain
MDNNESDLGLGISSVSSGSKDAVQSAQNIGELNVTAPGKYRVVRRNGSVAAFDVDKISVAMTKAFLAVEGNQAAASSRIHETVSVLSNSVFNALARNIPDGGTFHIEDIQDHVELALMRGGHQKVARSYVLYREQRNSERETEDVTQEKKRWFF